MVCGNFFRCFILLVFSVGLFSFPRSITYAAPNINITKHNLSATGPGTFKALGETRICVFCHTPHNATSDTPLWNKELKSQTYVIYTSDSRLPVMPSQPTGPTKLCLSCHDGTIALGATVNPSGGISMGGGATLPPSSLSYFGTNLSNHHPVVFSYPGAQKADVTGQLVDPALLSPTLVLGQQGGTVHCDTCHNPHDDTYGQFLVMDNTFSALCTACHKMTGWSTSGHATNATRPLDVTGILPRPPKNRPAWTTMKEWGCEVCHTPHLAATPQKLLNFCAAPCPAPYTSSYSCTTGTCHSSAPSPIHQLSLSSSAAARATSSVGKADIGGQIKKRSGHREQPGSAMLTKHRLKSSSVASAGGASCADCHNAHAVNNQKAVAPDASGRLKGVTGVDMNGTEVPSVRYEYEVCFKCHGDYNSVFPYVPRVINTGNKRTAFAEINPSFHPVIARGKNSSVPSIPSQFEPSMRPTSVIYCSDCHSDDSSSSRGPHGSDFPPILRQRYETADNTIENFATYALCYQCHDRLSILSDASFKKKINKTTSTGGGHSGHLTRGAPCSVCHDALGVPVNGMSGRHSHLINFDTRIVLPVAGNQVPIFMDLGTFSGSCTLVCHGRTHVNETYPQGGISSQRLLPLSPGFKGTLKGTRKSR